MTKTTFPVNGGAVPKPDRAAIMRRAWVIFRSAYGDSKHALKRGHRKTAFGYCLMLAWQDAKAAAAATAPRDATAIRIDALNSVITLAPFNENWWQASREISSARAEIARLSA
jgi:hypothetical protein